MDRHLSSLITEQIGSCPFSVHAHPCFIFPSLSGRSLPLSLSVLPVLWATSALHTVTTPGPHWPYWTVQYENGGPNLTLLHFMV